MKVSTLKDADGTTVMGFLVDEGSTDSFAVWNGSSQKVGSVHLNGDIWSASGKIGSVKEENGYVLKGATHVGNVDVHTGVVKDAELTTIGKVEGQHVLLAGAALVLLVR
jgi:hypothetical protein